VQTERSVLTLAGKCPFLIHIAATFQTPANLFYVMELYTGGGSTCSFFALFCILLFIVFE
jgi:hypothetical protein